MKIFYQSFLAAMLLGAIMMFTSACQPQETKESTPASSINKATIDKVIKELIEKHGEEHSDRINRCVGVVANLWTGENSDFEKFCLDNFVSDEAELEALFNSITTHFETLYGNMNKIALELKRPLHLDIGDLTKLDMMFGAYNPASHINADFFENNIAHFVALNFPFYSLDEKNELGKNWSRKQWAYARVGDLFTANVPAHLWQNISEVSTRADTYINNYNIMMGFVVDENMQSHFPEDMKLISHWNLRDEIKSQYSRENPLEKQKTIYEVMKHIINQTIPENVINNNQYQWNPFTNKTYENGQEVQLTAEPNTRYHHLLENFKSRKAIDAYSPLYPTYIKQKFEQDMEIPQEEVEAMFVELVSSPVAKQVGEFIKERLGRDLQPFDIWYDGFKARATLDQDELSKTTRKQFPNAAAYEADIPNQLIKLGFTPAKAKELGSRITVESSRGAGHAWGAQMKGQKAHLRTRIAPEGMDYKGFNIAVHELGHNVEQTITLYDVDHYMLQGVPNTAFTEAWAFVYQSRDLPLIGIRNDNAEKHHYDALDNFWSSFEIMGVSIVDMRVWKWLYENPNANEEQLKNAVIDISKDVWNAYYAPIFGIKDQPILAIYSHMIEIPLYLSAYPIGHLIKFQIEDQIKGKNLADEMQRMLVQGRITPQHWMLGAVGNTLSAQPTINAAAEAVKALKK